MKRLLSTLLIMGALATLLALGTWQMQRLAWKEGLIAQAQERPGLPAVPLADVLALPPDEWAYRRASIAGRFIGDPVRVFTTLSDPLGAYEGPGYWLMQAFEADGDRLFVNRGFIPFDLPPDVAVRPAPAGTIRFEGLVRPDDLPDFFTPDPDYGQRLLYRRSVEQLIEASGVSSALPLTLDMPASVAGGLPQAGETKFAFTNRHFEYALTWYGLAAVLLLVVGTVLIQRRRL